MKAFVEVDGFSLKFKLDIDQLLGQLKDEKRDELIQSLACNGAIFEQAAEQIATGYTENGSSAWTVSIARAREKIIANMHEFEQLRHRDLAREKRDGHSDGWLAGVEDAFVAVFGARELWTRATQDLYSEALHKTPQ